MDGNINNTSEFREKSPKWSWWDLFLVILILVSILALVAMFRTPIRHAVLSMGIEQGHLQTVLLFITTLIQASAIVGSVIFVTRRRGAVLKDLGLTGTDFSRNVINGLVGGLFLGMAIWFSGIIISLLSGPPPPQEVERFLSGVSTGKDVFLPFLAISVLAPLSEEIYFRGMVYPVFRTRFGPLVGMLLSGVFFGFMHLDLYRFIPLSLGGFVLAYIYEKTKTLTAPIIAHFTWNTLMLLSFFYLGAR